MQVNILKAPRVNKKIDRFCNIFAKRRTEFCQAYVAFSALLSDFELGIGH